MDFWETFAQGAEVLARGAIAYTAAKQVNDWMATEFLDIDDLRSIVTAHVSSRSVEELKAMDTVLRTQIKANSFNDQKLQKLLWIFASLHGGWVLREYRQRK